MAPGFFSESSHIHNNLEACALSVGYWMNLCRAKPYKGWNMVGCDDNEAGPPTKSGGLTSAFLSRARLYPSAV